MAKTRDDDRYDDEDDAPRRRRPRDDDDGDAPRSRRPVDDDEDDEPRSRRSNDEDDDDLPRPAKRKSKLPLILGILGVSFLLCCGGGVYAIYYGTKSVGSAANRMASTNNLRQIGIGAFNYNSVTGHLPADSYSADGKPLLSWRVHILPYIEEQNLYAQFRLDEPWDSPNNRRLLDQMPMVYATPPERTGKVAKGNRTFYRGFTGNGGAMAKQSNSPPAPGLPRGLAFVKVTDGISNTILALEAGDSIEWTRPGDLDPSPNLPFPKLGGIRPDDDKISVLFVDGSARLIRKSVAESMWRAGATANGGEPVNFD